jgi:hypothetical protein
MRAAPHSQLRGQVSDPAARAVDEDALPLFKVAMIEQTLPRAQGCQRQSRALNMVQGGRFGSEDTRVNRDVIRRGAIVIEARQGVDRVADRKAGHIRRQFRHDPREFVRGYGGEPVDGPLELVTRDGRGMNPYQCLTRTKRWCRNLFVLQSVETTWFVQPDRMHGRGDGDHAASSTSGSVDLCPSLSSRADAKSAHTARNQ